jgi:hypothetical protein
MLIESSEDYKEIFMPLLRRIGVILRQQIDGALAKEKPVKVFSYETPDPPLD